MNGRGARTEPGRPHDPDEALERLLEGNARFVANRGLDHDALRREELAAGQNPFAVIIGCADSRVPPEVVFDQGLGELFVVRVAGNTASDPLVVGSIEFALTHLGCPLVVVLGHQGCGAVAGAVAATVEGATAPGSIGDVVGPIVPVVQGIVESEPELPEDELLERSVRANVGAAVADLTARSSIVADLLDSGRVKLVGAEYRLDTGEVLLV